MTLSMVRSSTQRLAPKFFMALCLFFCLPFMIQLTHAEDRPDPVGKYINDFAEIIDDSDKAKIRSRLQSFDSEDDIEMTIVTINSVKDYDEKNIKAFSRKLFNDWGVGKMPENKGIMMVVAVQDRKVRIQMGNGYENKYDNAMKSIIEEDLAPAFRSQDYGGGIYKGTLSVIDEVNSPLSAIVNTIKSMWYWVLAVFVAFCGFLIRLLGDEEDYKEYKKMLEDDEDENDSFFGGGDSSDGGAEGRW